MNPTDARDPGVASRRHQEYELIRQLREVGAWLAENGEALQQHRDTTALPALLNLARVVQTGLRRLGYEMKLAPETREALDAIGPEGDSNVRAESAG